jgi:hypothetical protein
MKFRQRSKEIDAVQFTGHNDRECIEFCPGARDPKDIKANLIIPTSQGEVLAIPGYYIVKGYDGFYVSQPALFEASYERCE